MKDQLISYETAVLAKQKGFNHFVNAWYNTNKVLIQHGKYESVSFKDWNNYSDPIGRKKGTDGKNCLSAPTQSLLQKWLREVHDIHIMIGYCENGVIAQLQYIDPSWSIEIPKFDEYISHETYEDVLEKALMIALKTI